MPGSFLSDSPTEPNRPPLPPPDIAGSCLAVGDRHDRAERRVAVVVGRVRPVVAVRDRRARREALVVALEQEAVVGVRAVDPSLHGRGDIEPIPSWSVTGGERYG